jgi:hypothetical protein
MQRNLLCTMVLVLIGHFSMSQAKTCEAYWVVETERKVSPFTLVRIYDAEHTLVVERRLDVVVDIRSRRHQRKLKKIVDHYYNQSENDFPDTLFKFRRALSLSSRRRADDNNSELANSRRGSKFEN